MPGPACGARAEFQHVINPGYAVDATAEIAATWCRPEWRRGGEPGRLLLSCALG